MMWRDRVRHLLRWLTLVAGGGTTAVMSADASVGVREHLGASSDPNRGLVLLPNTLNATAEDRYAAHRSHSSHSSHGSHRSHRSGSGGVRQAPTVPTPQPDLGTQQTDPAPSVTPQTTPNLEKAIPKPQPQEASRMVIRVQAALMRRGYYYGDIDGLLGPITRAALKAFQASEGIPQTGRMDIATLTKLGISIP